MNDMDEIDKINWLDQVSEYKKTWTINSKAVELHAGASYTRSPEWCCSVDVSIYVENGKCPFSDCIYLHDNENNELDNLKFIIKDLINKIDNYNVESQDIFSCELKRSLKGYSEQELKEMDEEGVKQEDERARYLENNPIFIPTLIESMLFSSYIGLFEDQEYEKVRNEFDEKQKKKREEDFEMYPILFGKNKIKILGVKDIYPFLNNEQTQEKMTESIQEEARNKKKIKRLSDVYAGLFH